MMFLGLSFGLSLGLSLCLFLFALFLRLAAALKLQPLLLYLVAIHTVLRPWQAVHPVLAEGIFWTLTALTVLMWIVPLCRRVQDFIQARREDRAAVDLFRERLRRAKASGQTAVSTERLWR